jgi:hypothetical protein
MQDNTNLPSGEYSKNIYRCYHKVKIIKIIALGRIIPFDSWKLVGTEIPRTLFFIDRDGGAALLR